MSTSGVKVMTLRRSGRCACGASVAAGERGGWDRAAKVVLCPTCAGAEAPPVEPVPVVAPEPGESLMLEHARRVEARREKAMAGSWLTRVAYRFSDEPASTRAFAVGAEGERVAARRMSREGDPVVVLHSRGMGPSGLRGDIDHIAICPAGVVVVNAKHYKGARVRVHVSGGLLTPRREQLMVRGRDQTRLLTGMRTQRDVVAEAVSARFPDVPVTAVLCFVDGDTARGQSIDGIGVVSSRRMRRHLLRDGPLDEARRAEVADFLDRTFLPVRAGAPRSGGRGT